MVLDPSPNRAAIALSAPAKLNLALAVAPPRPEDGYHPICSWMSTIDLADELLLTRLEDDRLSRYAILWHDEAPVRSDIDWSITRDLAVRAHLLLERIAGRTLPVQLKLEKRIPVGGGLGGGSSNAAAMLIAIRALFQLDLSDESLIELAHQLGSDVPFFVHAGITRCNAATIHNLGERIDPAPPVSAKGLLILPDFGCPTPAVYRAFDATPRATDHDAFEARSARIRSLADSSPHPPGWHEQLFNDLADPAGAVAPRLTEIIRDAADTADATIHLTGSGSTCFLMLAEDHAPSAVEALRADLSAELESCAIIPFRTHTPSGSTPSNSPTP
ncbi:MAG: 4-(cytidine 5'-diphospho)-2-C-methyl-D-erythritol kinase [Phycisphaerales bacterium]